MCRTYKRLFNVLKFYGQLNSMFNFQCSHILCTHCLTKRVNYRKHIVRRHSCCATKRLSPTPPRRPGRSRPCQNVISHSLISVQNLVALSGQVEVQKIGIDITRPFGTGCIDPTPYTSSLRVSQSRRWPPCARDMVWSYIGGFEKTGSSGAPPLGMGIVSDPLKTPLCYIAEFVRSRSSDTCV